jgi:hypothetical protein
MNSNDLYVEETLEARVGYPVVWTGDDPRVALEFMREAQTNNRLELWTKAHASTEKGFAPLAFREAGSCRVMVSGTFRMLELA